VIERKRLQERFGCNSRPTPKQKVQIAGPDPDGLRDDVDLGLLAPVLGKERDRAPYNVVIGSGAAKRGQIIYAIG
jgi:hypothetical protein